MADITITPLAKPVRVTWRGAVIADTKNALELREGAYPPVLYIPRADANMEMLAKSAHKTHCPHKGTASYYSIQVGADISQNAIWTYETPLGKAEAIRDHLAFYSNRVDAIEQG